MVDSDVQVRNAPRRGASGGRSAQRPRNPELTKRDILVAAREEFCERGLDGARVDRIAEQRRANKRLLYHYFGNKEALYSAVLLDAYREIRQGEAKLHLGDLRARRGHAQAGRVHLRPLPRQSVVHPPAVDREHPAGGYVSQIAEIPRLHSPIVGLIRDVLAAGQEARRVPRAASTRFTSTFPIAGLSYFFFSNVHTLSVIFDVPLDSPREMTCARRHAVDVILGYLRA